MTEPIHTAAARHPQWQQVMFSTAGLLDAPSVVLDRLGRIVRGLDARLSLFDCVYDPIVARSDASRVQIRQRVEQRRRQVQAWADALREQGVEVSVSVHWDYPAYAAIVRQVLREKPDVLIVPAARANRSVQRYLTYTDHRLIEACPCPLWLLKEPEVYPHGTVVAAVDPGHAQDPQSRLDEQILTAAAIATRALSGASLHACHVAITGQDAEVDDLSCQVQHLSALHGVAKERVHVERGQVLAHLPPQLQALHAELVVMGAVSRSLPRSPSLTPTAEQLLDLVQCDVLVVKPTGFRCPVGRRPSLSLSPRAQQARSGATGSAAA